MTIRTDQENAQVRITSVCGLDKSNVQATQYQGTRESLLAVGVAQPSWFEVGKSGKRRHAHDGHPLDQRYETKRMAGGEWRITRWHLAGEPPYVPEQDEPVKTHNQYQASTSAVYNQPIETFHMKSDVCAWTWYIATKEQLIHAGLALPDMFPKKGSTSRVRKHSPAEQGDWVIDRRSDGRWRVCYTHGNIEITPELKYEMELSKLYQKLKQHFGDEDPTES